MTFPTQGPRRTSAVCPQRLSRLVRDFSVPFIPEQAVSSAAQLWSSCPYLNFRPRLNFLSFSWQFLGPPSYLIPLGYCYITLPLHTALALASLCLLPTFLPFFCAGLVSWCCPILFCISMFCKFCVRMMMLGGSLLTSAHSAMLPDGHRIKFNLIMDIVTLFIPSE